MNSTLNAQEFWNQKILRWENARYSPWLKMYPLSWTVRQRLRLATQIIRSRVPGDHLILELGCGSGHLAEALTQTHIYYLGLDFAPCAVEQAQQKINRRDFQFATADILTAPLPPSDICVFLGLVDWLEEADLPGLLQRIPAKLLLFSFTKTIPHSPYRVYRKWMDPRASDHSIRARTFQPKFMNALLDRAGFSVESLQSGSYLNPGCLVWAQRL